MEKRRSAYDKASARVERNREERSRLRGEALENIAIIGSVYAATKPSIEFNYRLRLMANNANLTEKQLRVVQQRIQQISNETKQTDTEILAGLSSLIAAGMEFETAIDTISSVGKAATTTGGEIEEFAQTTDALNKSLKINPRNMLSALDAVYVAGKEGKFEFRDMAQYFPALAAGMAKFGGSGVGAAAQLAAAAQVARDVTGDASRAATLVDNFLTKLTSPQTIKRFGQFGVDAETALRQGMQRNEDPFLLGLNLLHKAIGNDPLAVGKIFEDMEVQKMALALMQNTKRYQDVKAAALKGSGELDRDFQKVKEETAIKLKELGNAWSRLFRMIAGASGGNIGSIVQGLTELTRSVTEFVQRNPRLVGAITTATIGLVGLKVAVFGAEYATKLVQTPFDLADKAFKKFGLGVSFARVRLALLGAAAPAAAAGTTAAGAAAGTASVGFGALVATAAPFLIVGTAIAAIGFTIWKNWQPLKAFLGGLWEGLRQGLAPVGAAIEQAFGPLKGIRQWFGSLFEQIGLTGEQFAAVFSKGIWLGQTFGSGLGLVFTSVIGAIGATVQSIGYLGSSLKNLATGNWGALKTDTATFKKAIEGYHNAVGASFKNLFASPDYSAAGKAGDTHAKLTGPGKVPAPGGAAAGTVPGPSTSIQNNTFNVSIQVPPGAKPEEVARAARQELDKMIRDAEARRRSAMHN